MTLLKNTFKGRGLASLAHIPAPSQDAARPTGMLSRCPRAAPTPLVASKALAKRLGVARVTVKDERARMGLGSFKALGAAYVIASEAAAEGTAIKAATYVTASAGNHGLSVAAGARAFGAQAVIYLSKTVPADFAKRLEAEGAQVVIEGATYEESMEAAARAADQKGWRLLSDSSWMGYVERPHRLMEGYLTVMDEAGDQLNTPPSHIFVQAGVGGLAASVAAYARLLWGQGPVIVVVEPDQAPALQASIAQGTAVVAQGAVSCMGRLDCKEPSLIALKGLAHDADYFLTVTEDQGRLGRETVAACDLPSSYSGAAGLAGALALSPVQRQEIELSADAHVLAFLSEGPVA